MEYRILGPLEVLEGGEPVRLRRLKQRLVLAVLLLHANEFVARERLIDELWGEAPPPTAKKAVNGYVSQLRKALTRNGHDPIATADGGYRLEVDGDQLDAARLGQLLASARERASTGELEAAGELLREALGLWRGPTLSGLLLESHGREEIAQLDELRLTALMERIDCDLALGRQDQSLGELNLLVREHPLRERLRAQQMLALYRADRQVDALDAYAEARRTLVDDLGVEPSEALQRLQQAILRHDPALETPGGTAALNGVAPSAASPPPSTPTGDAEVGEGRTRTRFRRRRWPLALAAVVLVSGAASAATVLSSSAHATPHVVPDSIVQIDPRGKIVSVTRVDAEPQEIVATSTAIWTVNDGESTVSRYDLSTHTIQSSAAPVTPFNMVADAAGDVWVSSLVKSLTIKHFVFGTGGTSGDPLRPERTSLIPLTAPGATALAFGAGYLWAIAGPKSSSGDDLVSLVDPAINKVVRHWHIGHGTTSIALGDGVAWVGGFGNERADPASQAGYGTSWLTVLRAATPRPQSYRLERGLDMGGPISVGVGYGKVWVLTCGTCGDGGGNEQLLEFDPGKKRVVRRYQVGMQEPNALAVGAGSVWLVNGVYASLMQLDPKTHRIRTIPVGNPFTAAICGITATRDTLWVAVGNRCG